MVPNQFIAVTALSQAGHTLRRPALIELVFDLFHRNEESSLLLFGELLVQKHLLLLDFADDFFDYPSAAVSIRLRELVKGVIHESFSYITVVCHARTDFRVFDPPDGGQRSRRRPGRQRHDFR